ncbi:MAG: response regulator transcription factor [Rhizobiaceae bacterium]|nr:response regulator transcription factor [Hyphomicrobiales bacterium]NRB31261.1 response regulator transcription factor [Rhizobiaceae bacterium]
MADSAAGLMPSDDAAHILVIDDDRRIRDLLSRYLSEQRFRVSTASDAADARRKLDGLSFDLLIVDVMMPGENGTEFTNDIREKLDVPVLMLTALGEVDARIKGLEAGADDYLAKPFDPRELVLRINSILKRVRVEAPPSVEQVLFGPYTFSVLTRELKKDGEPVKLTDREREIMVMFAQNAGQVVPRLDLVGEDATASERTVDVQINRLRRKIENDPAAPTWLQTVRGIGYKLQIE